MLVTDFSPEIVYTNAGGAITMAGQPSLDREITTIAVRDGQIMAMGPEAALQPIIGNSPLVDLAGQIVMPGLIDCHNHFLRTSLSWERLQLDPAKSIEELLALIGERVAVTKPGDWILCSSRWHETNLGEGRLPTAKEIDQVAPNNPVYLPRGGHVVVTNTRGLELAGIRPNSADPEGGQYVRDQSGELNGMLLERPAFTGLTRLLPQATVEEQKAALRLGIKAHNQRGITAIRDPGLTAEEMRVYQAVIPEQHAMRTSLLWRVNLGMTADQREEWVAGLAPVSGFGTGWIDIWGLKITMDGGVEGGYFNQPYANNPEFRGIPLASGDDLSRIAGQADGLGWRVAVHVVGDAAMSMVLDSFDVAGLKNGGHTLEHAFSPAKGEIERTKSLGLAVTLQHSLVYGLGGNMVTYWGPERAAACTPSKEWIESGVLVGAGTDSNVTEFDPWLNLYGFMTRDTENAGILGPEHRISIQDALAAYTTGSAGILGQETSLGSLELRKNADFICLAKDPLTCSADQIRAMEVQRTVVGGKTVYERSA